MIFDENSPLKHVSLYYYYEFMKTEDLPDDHTLFFDFENGQYSITLGDLKERARQEIFNHQLRKGVKNVKK